MATFEEITRHGDLAPDIEWVGRPLPLEPIAVADPDPQWATLFNALAGHIRSALGVRVLDLQHVGSTSVPDLRRSLSSTSASPSRIRTTRPPTCLRSNGLGLHCGSASPAGISTAVSRRCRHERSFTCGAATARGRSGIACFAIGYANILMTAVGTPRRSASRRLLPTHSAKMCSRATSGSSL